MTNARALIAPPLTDDAHVPWKEVIAQIDLVGESAHALMLLARDSMIPALRSAKAYAKTALGEIETLEQSLLVTRATATAHADQEPSTPTMSADHLVLIPAPARAHVPRRGRVQCNGSAFDRDAAGQKIGPPRRCLNSAPAEDPWCHAHAWQKPSA